MLIERVKCIILGGGQGKRLFPLTQERSKPAVSIAGKYRLIDITLSNSINSGIKDIFILTQFNSKSLNNHVSRTYKFDYFSNQSVQLLAAELTPINKSWFQGTADAVRQHWVHYRLDPQDDVIVLAGDHLYEMDYTKIVEAHRKSKADVTVSTALVPRKETVGLGIMQINKQRRVINFAEKTQEPKILRDFALNQTDLKHFGIQNVKAPAYLASMGVYVFKGAVLQKLLQGKEKDFGKEIIPKSIFKFRAYTYLFDGYWKDIGTIRSFYEANLSLARDNVDFDLFSAWGRLFTHPRFLPPLRIYSSKIEKSLLSEGSIIDKATIEESVIGLRSMIGKGTRIERTYMMGADYYDWVAQQKPPGKYRKVGIGKNCVIRNAILDKNVSIGDGVQIVNRKKHREFDGKNYYIRDGIVIIPKNAEIKPGTII